MSRGFKITELWCLDGAEYRSACGYDIRSSVEGYIVEFPTPAEAVPLLDSEQTSFHQVSISMVIPHTAVAGVVIS